MTAPRFIASNHAVQGGFTYLLVLFFVALSGAGLVAVSELWETAMQREREAELLFVGGEIRLAIGRYYEATPGGFKTFPAHLEDLLKDPRFPDTRRHLRKLYRDPVAANEDWVTIRSPQGGIMGIASSSAAAPLKRAGFDRADRAFEAQAVRLKEKLRYRDWEFVYDPAMRASAQPHSPIPQ